MMDVIHLAISRPKTYPLTAPLFGPELSVSFETQALLEPLPEHELFRFRFGKNLDDDGADNTFRLHIEPVGYVARDEIWHTSGPVEIGQSNGFTYAECEQHLAAHIQMDPNSTGDFRDLTADAYARLLSAKFWAQKPVVFKSRNGRIAGWAQDPDLGYRQHRWPRIPSR